MLAPDRGAFCGVTSLPTPGELADTDTALREAWISLAPIQQSIVELLACSYAPGPMLVSFPSTFDEHILQIRSWLRRPGADAQHALFLTTMRRWMGEKGGAF